MTIWRDPSLPHQIVLTFRPGTSGSMEVAVTCNCLGLRQLASRPKWDDPREPMRIWRKHMETNSQLFPHIRQLSAREPTATCAVVTACQWPPELGAHRTAEFLASKRA